jgi:hypothetical protein
VAWRRWLAIGFVAIITAILWAGIPAMMAAGLALDHPAWARRENDPGSTAVSDTTSWWPPGRQYEWVGSESRVRHVAIDPWDSPTQGHVWTVAVFSVGTFLILCMAWLLRPRDLAHRTAAPVRAPSAR